MPAKPLRKSMSVGWPHQTARHPTPERNTHATRQTKNRGWTQNPAAKLVEAPGIQPGSPAAELARRENHPDPARPLTFRLSQRFDRRFAVVEVGLILGEGLGDAQAGEEQLGEVVAVEGGGREDLKVGVEDVEVLAEGVGVEA